MIEYECKYHSCPYCKRVKVASVWSNKQPWRWLCQCPGRLNGNECSRCGGVKL